MTTEKKQTVEKNPPLIRHLSDEEMKRPGWEVWVDGASIIPVRSLHLYHNGMQISVRYGMRAEGYDGILIHELGGGGAVPIPYVIWRNELWIGLLEEERKNMGGVVLDAPGGFLDPGQTHFETAVREFKEEVGVGEVKISDVPLGEPANSNRAWFDTSSDGEGAHFYPVEFLPEHLEVDMDSGASEDIRLPLRFKEGVLKPIEGDRAAEKIFGCRFYYWSVAATKSDMFANAMFSRLFAHLVETGRASALFSS